MTDGGSALIVTHDLAWPTASQTDYCGCMTVISLRTAAQMRPSRRSAEVLGVDVTVAGRSLIVQGVARDWRSDALGDSFT